jgi:TrmH family RNA methyltransferase
LLQKITSKDNKLIKNINKLINNYSYRKDCNQAILFGEHLINEAIKYKLLQTLLINQNSINKYSTIINKIGEDSTFVTTKEVIDKINPLNSDIDIFGIVTIKPAINNLIYEQDAVYLENIQDPGNLGTILRAALAAGVKNIFLSNGSVDVYNYKVIRSSQGIQFGLNIFQDYNFDDINNNYKGIVLATTPHAHNIIYDFDYTKTSVMWVFGNEGKGISNELLKKIENKVKIPISQDVESLNIAMAASICLFEVLRQRL